MSYWSNPYPSYSIADPVLSTGAIVGIVCGALAGTGLLITIGVIIAKYWKKSSVIPLQQQQQQQQQQPQMSQIVLPMGGNGQRPWQRPPYYPSEPTK